MLNIDPYEGLRTLKEICFSEPKGRDSLLDLYTRELFPKLDLPDWISHISSRIPKGKVTSFGSAARGLGTEKAAISVRSCTMRYKIENHHRFIYSDGRVPLENVDLLKDELTLKEKDGSWFITDKKRIVDIKMEYPPFISLGYCQERLGKLLVKKGEKFNSIVGIDISSKDGDHYCSLCRTDLEGNREDLRTYSGNLGIPYVSGFLFFREGPLIIASLIEGVESGLVDDDTLLVLDGNGRLHPKGMGIACQTGVVLDKKTSGVAKKLLCGEIGEWKSIEDYEETANINLDGEIKGIASRRNRGKPVFISSGHRTDLVKVSKVLIGTKKGRIPEPTRWAHEEANIARRSKTPSGNL
jgi:deoxyribonuclease V